MRSAANTTARHRHGSVSKPGPIPIVRARRETPEPDRSIHYGDQQAKPVARQCVDGASRHVPSRRGEQPGTQTGLFEDPVGCQQAQIGLVCRHHRELVAPSLGGGLVETMQDHRVTGGTLVAQPADRAGVGLEVIAWCAGRDEQ